MHHLIKQILKSPSLRAIPKLPTAQFRNRATNHRACHSAGDHTTRTTTRRRRANRRAKRLTHTRTQKPMPKLTTLQDIQRAASCCMRGGFCNAGAAGFADGFHGCAGADCSRLAEAGAYSPKNRRGQGAPKARSERSGGNERGGEAAADGRGEGGPECVGGPVLLADYREGDADG